jgi:hypothetical protein
MTLLTVPKPLKTMRTKMLLNWKQSIFFLMLIFPAIVCFSQTTDDELHSYIILEDNILWKRTFLFQDSNFVYFEEDNGYFKVSQDKVTKAVGIDYKPTTNYHEDMLSAGSIGTTGISLQLSSILLVGVGAFISSENTESKLPLVFISTGGLFSLTGILLELRAWSKVKEANMKMAATLLNP